MEQAEPNCLTLRPLLPPLPPHRGGTRAGRLQPGPLPPVGCCPAAAPPTPPEVGDTGR